MKYILWCSLYGHGEKIPRGLGIIEESQKDDYLQQANHWCKEGKHTLIPLYTWGLDSHD